MKKCPACDKTYEDPMKFCQIDGTELVADEPSFDPYATVVGHKFDLPPEHDKPAESPVEEIIVAPIEETVQAEIIVEESPIEPSAAETAEQPQIHETTGSTPIAAPDEVLELPGMDPLKTMYVSESELKEVFSSEAKDETSETPTMDSIDSEPPAAEFGAPPPSPFSVPETPFEPLPL